MIFNYLCPGESKSLSVEKQKEAFVIHQDNDLMTASLDPVLLMQQTHQPNVSRDGYNTPPVHGLPVQEPWAISSGPNRPNSLFEYDTTTGSTIKAEVPPNSSNGSSSHEDAPPTTSEAQVKQHIKDIYLQDLSDSKSNNLYLNNMSVASKCFEISIDHGIYF